MKKQLIWFRKIPWIRCFDDLHTFNVTHLLY